MIKLPVVTKVSSFDLYGNLVEMYTNGVKMDYARLNKPINRVNEIKLIKKIERSINS